MLFYLIFKKIEILNIYWFHNKIRFAQHIVLYKTASHRINNNYAFDAVDADDADDADLRGCSKDAVVSERKT